jgi:ATP-dependent exoDNAse (exonuclease V) alpha subunit
LTDDHFLLNWNIQYDYDNIDETVENLVSSENSCHIDGSAGTGKTYLVKKIMENLDLKNIKYLAFSPTNKGARLINGNTIHSVYYKFKNSKKVFMSMMKDVHCIFIDEVSMMHEMFYRLFIMIKRTFPKVRFIIAGDFEQLPPVCDTWTGDYKNSAAMHSLCGGNRIQLTKCRRADSVLFNLCQNVSSVEKSKFPVKFMTFKNIAFKHETRIAVNKECMDKFVRGQHTFIPSNPRNAKTQDAKLCKGVPIVAHKTSKANNILNSERFVVKSVNDENLTITDGDREITIPTQSFHKYFYLGFCITVHACQGETFKEKYTIFDWDMYHFDRSAKYVALSRANDINNIQIA